MPKAAETVLEIDLNALTHNYTYLRRKLRPETKFLGVVKAFAYGSDSIAIARKLEDLGADYLAVAYVKEGIALRDAGIKAPILVLHPQPVHFDQLIERCLEPSIYSQKTLSFFLETALKHGQTNYPVHLKFNTGLNRLGFKQNDIATILDTLKNRDEVRIISVFSHLAASEDKKETAFTNKQIEIFEEITAEVDAKTNHRPFKHLLNTSGIINYPNAQYDMVRSGIGLYGYGNEARIDLLLKPIATLKSVISQIHKVAPQESVGYNRAYTSTEDVVTATIPVGHADGIGRQYGRGKTHVLVNNRKAPIIGNVCMDMIMINITGIDCKEGDEVILFGKTLAAQNFAATGDTISYELLTGISQRVKRVLVDG